MHSSSTGHEDEGPSIAYRPRRRQAKPATSAARPKKAATKRPVKLMMDEDAYEVLVIHALRRGLSMSDLVMDLVRKNLNEWTIHAKPGPKSEAS